MKFFWKDSINFPCWKNDFENQSFEMFEEVVNNFGKSVGDIIGWKCLFKIDAYMVLCPFWSKNLGRTLLLASSFHSVKDNCPESKEQQHNTAIYFYFCCCITYCGILYLYRTIARRVGSDTIAPRGGGGGGDDGGSHSAICSLLRDQWMHKNRKMNNEDGS